IHWRFNLTNSLPFLALSPLTKVLLITDYFSRRARDKSSPGRSRSPRIWSIVTNGGNTFYDGRTRAESPGFPPAECSRWQDGQSFRLCFESGSVGDVYLPALSLCLAR